MGWTDKRRDNTGRQRGLPSLAGAGPRTRERSKAAKRRKTLAALAALVCQRTPGTDTAYHAACARWWPLAGNGNRWGWVP